MQNSKKKYSKINRYRRTFHNTRRHRKKSKYIGGTKPTDRFLFRTLHEKSNIINAEANVHLENITSIHNEAKEGLEKAKENVEIAELDLTRETDQFNQHIAVEARMITSEKNLLVAREELYNAENIFEKADDELTKAEAEVAACDLYKTRKANIDDTTGIIALKNNRSKTAIIYNKVNEEWKLANADYLAKRKLYEDKIKELTKEVKPKQTMYGNMTSLFHISDKDKIKQKEALNTYYKNNPDSKNSVDQLKSDKKSSEKKFHTYMILKQHLRTDYDNAVELLNREIKKQAESDELSLYSYSNSNSNSNSNIPSTQEVQQARGSDGSYESDIYTGDRSKLLSVANAGGRKKSKNKKINTKKRHIKRRPTKNK